MTHFSDELRSALAEQGWTQGEYVERSASITQPTLSRYLSGKELPKGTTFDLVCKPFPPAIHERLAAAYVLDQVPESARDLVTVTTVREGEAPKEYAANKPIPGSLLERNLAVLAREALKDPNLAMVLDYLASSRDNRQPMSNDSGEDLRVFTVEEEALIEKAKKDVASQEAQSRARGRKRYVKPKAE